MCQDYIVTDIPSSTIALADMRGIVAGIDWSGGGASGHSRTALWIWGVISGGAKHNFRLKTLYFKIYPEANPISGGVVDHICDMCERYNVQLAIGDAGAGALANSNVRERLGPQRMLQLQYKGSSSGNSTASRPIFWNKIDRFIADRTFLIDNFLLYVKRGGVVFPNVKQMQPAIKDMLAVYEEETQQGKKVWRHGITEPDDALHAMIFGFAAAKFLTADPVFSYNSER